MLKLLKLIILAAILALSFDLSAASAAVDTFVIVPDSPGGANFAGCYRADRDLFGNNRLTMCFERRGTYKIRGGNRCDGSLDWRVSGREISVNLHRADCRGRVSWARATVDCRGTGRLLGAAIREFTSRVITPNMPRVRELSCTYRPTVRGYRNTTFRAMRN